MTFRAEFLFCDVSSLPVFLFFFFFLFQFHVITLTLTWRCGPKPKASFFTLLFFFPGLSNTHSNVHKTLLDLCPVTSSYLQLVPSLESSSSFSRAANCPNGCTLTLSRLLFNSSNGSLTIKSKSIHLPLACRASYCLPLMPSSVYSPATGHSPAFPLIKYAMLQISTILFSWLRPFFHHLCIFYSVTFWQGRGRRKENFF